MLDASAPVEALVFDRVVSFPHQLKTAVPDLANFAMSSSVRLSMFYTIVATGLRFLWNKWILRRDCFPIHVFPISAAWIAAQKSLYSKQPNAKRLSTNDILTSHLLRVTQCQYGGMAINLRGRLPGIHNSLAGNYESVILYPRSDFLTPQQIRESISHPSGSVFKRVTEQTKFPTPKSWFVKVGNCTNWAGLYGDRDMQLPGAGKMLRHEPLPILDEVPMPLSLFIIFAPRKGELAVLANDTLLNENEFS